MPGPPPEGMAACSICGRNFNEDRLEKHEVICKKTKTKKRKVFDVTKQRVEVSNSIDSKNFRGFHSIGIKLYFVSFLVFRLIRELKPRHT